MPRSSPVANEIPRWPKTTAILNNDGTGRLTIDGRSEELRAGDIDAARAIVLERVTATAAEVGRPVRLDSTDPDGEWELAIHPDGDVQELLARPISAEPPAGAMRVPRRPHVSQRRSKPETRRRIVQRAGALIALLAVLGTATAVVISAGGDDTRKPPRPTASSPQSSVRPGAINGVIATARRKAARQQAIANARHDRATRLRVARRRATHRRAAIKRARRRRVDARRAKARKTARARAPRRTAPTPPPRRVVPPAAPPPPPPPSRPSCGAFDLC